MRDVAIVASLPANQLYAWLTCACPRLKAPHLLSSELQQLATARAHTPPSDSCSAPTNAA